MGTYDAAAKTAFALLKKKGAAATLVRVTTGEYDPVTQTGAQVEASHAYRAVGLPPGKSAEFVLGSLVGRNIREFYMAQDVRTLDPLPGDFVDFGGNRWRVVWVQTYDPAGDGSILTKAYAER